MRCKTCHYSLENLTEHRCPECGRAFDPADPRTFLSASNAVLQRSLTVQDSVAGILMLILLVAALGMMTLNTHLAWIPFLAAMPLMIWQLVILWRRRGWPIR